ncbi:MAG: bifunctional tRNA (5-methylaminomethyl-2-thiouridine)(34)-methyltransferase MnmD/FAD-dependent 5-carboxymethylaminomethyl-2-thiouridine(34) oxidoreductase MnmC [Alphaproteobacteria bacterium]|nr:bifunctional tRNA (5-methylaminomethyl-2-thiouridine)(34)-methyltransferase MnmD/FAD-dependent 5-carboxymethylaminomethyl-2-thiouridine(34) oxidoreductase MnmC [Alphaproteobacteria bacterium]
MTRDTLYSARFDDVYFSRDGGLAETRHVFLAGNDLPAAWKDRDHFTIAETGFGTGLNLLAAWQRFEETTTSDQRLHFVSFEKYPLSATDIKNALSPMKDAMGAGGDVRLARYLDSYPVRLSGFHRVSLTSRVTLTLVFDNVNDALPNLIVPRGVDAWFLDGFTPAKNPEMWTDTVFRAMAALSAPGATFATFTAAGFVRRSLEAAGFSVRKTPGFGRKKDMTVGVLAGESASRRHRGRLKKIAIIGGGLAGTACAYILQQRGYDPVLFEESGSLAAGASGNRIGMLNPRLYAQRNPMADFYASAFAFAGRVLKTLPSQSGFYPCGTLHLVTDETKEKRFRSLLTSGLWPADAVRLVDAAEASVLAGVSLTYPALWLPGGGVVHPAALCALYAAETTVCLVSPVTTLTRSSSAAWSVNGEDFDVVILACGAGVLRFAQTADLPLHTVRGQVTWLSPTPATEKLRCNLCYGGYLTPTQDGVHVVGSTFQKWLDHTAILPEDDRDNLRGLAGYAPALAEGAEIIGGQAGLRTASKDRFPVIGAVPDAPGLYVSTAHGSHGVITSLAGAALLADLIAETPLSQSAQTVRALSPDRFVVRNRRKNRSA